MEQYECKRLDLDALHLVYREHLTPDFPPAERKPLSLIHISWLSYPSIQRYRLRTVVPCSAASPFSCSTQPFFCSLRMAIPASAARCRASSSWMPASPYFSR